MGEPKSEVWDAVRGALAASRRTPVRRVRVEEPRLSFVQEGIWLHQRRHGDPAAYNTTLAIELLGELDRSALQDALNEVVRRHEILRTSFIPRDGVPRQKISAEVSLRLGFCDLSGIESPPTLVRRLVLTENQRRFDLREAPLWRFLLLRLGEREHVLLLSIHHLIWDQMSFSIWLRELSARYAAFLNETGASPGLQPDLQVQYADYAVWDRDQSAAKEQIQARARRLAGSSSRLEFPVDNPRPTSPTFRGRSRWFDLDPETSARLKSWSNAGEATPFMAMLTAYACLLRRYGNRDFLVGTPYSKRSRREFLPLIGPMINLLMLRLQVRGEAPIDELLANVREIVLEGHAAQDVPYEELLAASRADRSSDDGSPLRTLFTLYRIPPPLRRGGLEWRPMEADDGKARVDLELYCWETADGDLCGRWIFNTDLMEDPTTARIREHFLNILSGIAEDPRRTPSDLPLLTETERELFLRSDEASIESASLAELFEAQAARTPDAAAIRERTTQGLERTVSYGVLRERADHVAVRLRRRGVGVGSLVAILLERGVEQLVAALGVIRAGAAYLPLDPSDPARRLQFLIEDAGALLLLTTQSTESALQDDAADDLDVRTLFLDELLSAPSSASASTTRPPSSLPKSDPEDPAYVMYTSGSTGRPKGIAVPQRAVLRLVRDAEYVSFRAGTRVAHAANPSFDAAVFEIWGALLHGATLLVLPRETLLAPKAFADALAASRIDALFLTTALFNRTAAESPSAFRCIGDLLFGGEKVDPAAVRRVLLSGGPERLLHVYGPTENTTFSTWRRVDKVDEGATTVPIGRPIRGTQVHVLGTALHRLPVGVAGEICLAGAGLALGYPGRPAQTAARFVPDPFAGESGQTSGGRLYRTGDLARLRIDGELEFLTRIDDQLKLRGHRIEPEEIRKVLASHPQVEGCVVLAARAPQAARGRELRLVAYVVLAQERPPDLAEVLAFLKERLPRYMIPAAFVPVEAIPLTANGKIDRRALAALDRGAPTTSNFVAPHTDVERRLVDIWRRVLWLERDLGIHENFFDLGGHSLLAAVLAAEVEKELEIELPPAALATLSTVSDLAGHLEPTLDALAEGLAADLLRRDRPDSSSAACTTTNCTAAAGDAEEKSTKAGSSKNSTTTDSSAPSPDFFRKLLAYTAGWRGERVATDGLLVGLQRGGHETPLFWCLQGFEELSSLANSLGESRPVYGMRSGHLVMQYSAENIRALAACYVDEILQVDPHGPYLIGGNCQGSYIAWAAAEELRRRGKEVALLALLLLDFRQALPYAGRAALFFGEEISRSSAGEEQPREPDWQSLYPAGFSIDPISGEHRCHFVEPHLQDFADKLRRRLAEAERRRPSPAGQETTSRGTVLLGLRGVSPEGPEAREWAEIHQALLTAHDRSWTAPEAWNREIFSTSPRPASPAQIARTRWTESAAELAAREEWTLDAAGAERIVPLWKDLFPHSAEVNFVHVVRSPTAVAEILSETRGTTRERGLLLWALHHLDAEQATRTHRRSWRRFTEVFADEPKRPADDHEPTSEALRDHPWIAAVHRALLALTEGREIAGRMALDSLRSALDEERRAEERDRLLEENDRIREKSHFVWQENERVRADNENLYRDLEAARQEIVRLQDERRHVDAHHQEYEKHRKSQIAELRQIEQNLRQEVRTVREETQVVRQELYDFQQRKLWKLTAPLRGLYALLRKGSSND